MQEVALACVRALPSLRVTTLGLAAEVVTARSCVPFPVVAGRAGGRVTSLG